MAVKRQVRARDRSELDPLSSWIDDASYSTAEVRWDRSSRSVVVPFTNYCDEPDFPAGKLARRGVLVESWYRPWFRATLTVHSVRSMRPEPAALLEPGLLQDIEWIADGRVVRVYSINDEAGFELEVDRFDVELVVTDEIEHWRKHHYGRFLPWDGHGAALEGDPPPD